MCIIIKEEVHEFEREWRRHGSSWNWENKGRTNLNALLMHGILQTILKVYLGMNTFKFYLKTTKLNQLH